MRADNSNTEWIQNEGVELGADDLDANGASVRKISKKRVFNDFIPIFIVQRN
jgi:hypothetical protein